MPYFRSSASLWPVRFRSDASSQISSAPTLGGRWLSICRPSAKRLLIHDPEIQHAFAGSGPGLQFRVDLPDVWILPEELQALLQFIEVERRPGPASQSAGDVAIAQPLLPCNSIPR